IVEFYYKNDDLNDPFIMDMLWAQKINLCAQNKKIKSFQNGCSSVIVSEEPKYSLLTFVTIV
ncbi:hypothetical protein ACQUZI_10000, partial [Streptococcus pyogenes]|uniref:hypothetical protein n=1 Tax=Streptococcus pyogenes TaxID=1314 RepID=UPI003DA03EA1